MNLTKVALVTGGARRIGAAIVRKLHQKGMNVIIHYRHSEQQAKDLSQELNHIRPHSTHIIRADLNNMDQINRLIQESISAWGRLDVIVNNASSFYKTPLNNTDLTQWQDLINSNFMAPFFIIQAAILALEQSKGSVINIIDVHALKPIRDYSVYCAAKAGLLSLTKSFALELAPKIRVNGIAPNVIMWPERQEGLDEDLQQKILKKIPLRRIGHPEDIANCVEFLIDQPFITGEIIRVDGGRGLT